MSDNKSDNKIVIRRSWRAETGRLIVFSLLCIAALFLPRLYPLPPGSKFPIMWFKIILWVLPVLAFLDALIRIYNVRYVLDEDGIEAREGILSTWQRITRIKFEDIRNTEIEQTIVERILNIGMLCIDTAGTSDLEVIMDGIGRPYELQKTILNERQRCQSASAASPGHRTSSNRD